MSAPTTTPTTPSVSSILDTSQSNHPSGAIHQGADLIIELLEHEKARLGRLYHGALKNIEASLKIAQAKNEGVVKGLERKISAQNNQIKELSSNLHHARTRTTSLEAELEKLRDEHESLKASLGGAGLVYLHGHLRFNEDTTRIVGDFVKGARIQQRMLSSSPLNDSKGLCSSGCHDFSGAVGPTEFFGVLSGCLEHGRKFAEGLQKHQQSEVRLSAFIPEIDEPLGPSMSPVKVSPNAQLPSSRGILQASPENIFTDPQKPMESGKRPAPFLTSSSSRPAKQQRTL